MKEHNLKKLIASYLDGTATEAERYLVECWFESFQQDPDETSNFSAEQSDATLADRLIARAVEQKARKIFPLWKIITSAAAMLVLIPILAFLYLNVYRKADHQSLPTFEKYATGLNQLKRIELPDSTVVFLNANSSIQVPNLFNAQKERKVMLNGEAFFEVKRDVKRPFKIQVGELEVRVLGTSFNIKAYNELKDIKIAVATGKVMVSRAKDSLAALLPQQELTYDKISKIYRTNVNVSNRNDWKNGTIILDKASFDELNTAFYNTYGSRLISDDKKLLTERYNVTIRSSRTEEQTIKQLCEIFMKEYRKEGNAVIIF